MIDGASSNIFLSRGLALNALALSSFSLLVKYSTKVFLASFEFDFDNENSSKFVLDLESFLGNLDYYSNIFLFKGLALNSFDDSY